MYILIGIILILAFCLFNRQRKKKICQKLCSMNYYDKCSLLSELIEPFGYCYIPSQDIFSTSIDAWQREFGYTALFDRYAPLFDMVFDCQPVYFDYDNHTWLIEFWKGQYGINTGCEVGIYKADSVIASIQRNTTLFHSVNDNEMLPMSMDLYSKDTHLVHLSKRHWWLTIFDVGKFSEPKDLSIKIHLTFPNKEMLRAFVKALQEEYDNQTDLCNCGLQVSFLYQASSIGNHSCLRKLLCKKAQLQNRLFCHLFLWITRPFEHSLDRVLCLYFYLPFAFRRIMKNKKHQRCLKKCHRKCGKSL